MESISTAEDGSSATLDELTDETAVVADSGLSPITPPTPEQRADITDIAIAEAANFLPGGEVNLNPQNPANPQSPGQNNPPPMTPEMRDFAEKNPQEFRLDQWQMAIEEQNKFEAHHPEGAPPSEPSRLPPPPEANSHAITIENLIIMTREDIVKLPEELRTRLFEGSFEAPDAAPPAGTDRREPLPVIPLREPIRDYVEYFHTGRETSAALALDTLVAGQVMHRTTTALTPPPEGELSTTLPIKPFENVLDRGVKAFHHLDMKAIGKMPILPEEIEKAPVALEVKAEAEKVMTHLIKDVEQQESYHTAKPETTRPPALEEFKGALVKLQDTLKTDLTHAQFQATMAETTMKLVEIADKDLVEKVEILKAAQPNTESPDYELHTQVMQLTEQAKLANDTIRMQSEVTGKVFTSFKESLNSPVEGVEPAPQPLNEAAVMELGKILLAKTEGEIKMLETLPTTKEGTPVIETAKATSQVRVEALKAAVEREAIVETAKPDEDAIATAKAELETAKTDLTAAKAELETAEAAVTAATDETTLADAKADVLEAIEVVKAAELVFTEAKAALEALLPPKPMTRVATMLAASTMSPAKPADDLKAALGELNKTTLATARVQTDVRLQLQAAAKTAEAAATAVE
jgi:hypothetical protein